MATEPDRYMLPRAQGRAAKLGLDVKFERHPAEALITGGWRGLWIAGDTLTARGNRVSNNAIQRSQEHGVIVTGAGAAASGITGNRIAGHVKTGVTIAGGNGQALTGNRIEANGGMAIDLGAYGPTANDPGDGDAEPNRYQNSPQTQLGRDRPRRQSRSPVQGGLIDGQARNRQSPHNNESVIFLAYDIEGSDPSLGFINNINVILDLGTARLSLKDYLEVNSANIRRDYALEVATKTEVLGGRTVGLIEWPSIRINDRVVGF